MNQCLIEVTACLVEEIDDRLFTNAAAQRQRVDEHTYRISNTQIGTTVANRGDTDTLVVGEAGQRIECGSKCQMGKSQIMVAAECFDCREVHGTRYLTGCTMFQGIGEV